MEVYTTWIMMSELPAWIVFTPHRFNIYFNAYLVLFQLPFILLSHSLVFIFQLILYSICEQLSTSIMYIINKQDMNNVLSQKDSMEKCLCVCLCKIKSSLTWYNTKSQSCWIVVHEKKMLQFYNKSMHWQRVCSYFFLFYSQITQLNFLALVKRE